MMPRIEIIITVFFSTLICRVVAAPANKASDLPTENAPPSGGGSSPFCDSQKSKFALECNSQFSDTGNKDFCSEYGVQCRGWRRISKPKNFSQNQPQTNSKPIPQNSPRNNPSDPSKPSPPSSGRGGPGAGGIPNRSPDDVAYCNSYAKEYYALCLKGTIPDFATTFCSGFSKACPGVPYPGTLVGAPPNPVQTFPVNPSPSNQLPSSGPDQPVNSPFMPTSPNLSAVPNVPSGLPSIPTNPTGAIPSLPGGLPSLPTGGIPGMSSLPTGGLPSIPSGLPTGGLPTGGLPIGGLPTGGIPSVPMGGGQVPGGIGLGQGVQAPFFGGQSGTAISPLSGVGTGTSLNAAGVPVGTSSGVGFGGLPGLSSLGGIPGLGGKRRRRRSMFKRTIARLL